MKKLLFLLALITAGAHSLSAQTDAFNGFCMDGNVRVTTSGLASLTTVQQSYPKCTVNVYYTGTTTLVTALFKDNIGTPLSNPFTANQDGSWLFFAADGQGYDVTMNGGTAPNVFPKPFTLTDLKVGGGGGGGGSGTVTSVSCNPSLFPLFTCIVNTATTTANMLFTVDSVNDLTFIGNASGVNGPLNDVSFIAGTNMTLAESGPGQNLTFNGTNFQVNGTTVTTVSGNLNYIAGSGVTLTPAPGSITITSTGGSGCTLGTIGDTDVLSVHPLGTCYGSSHFTWDDASGNENLIIGDFTTTTNAREAYQIGPGNVINTAASDRILFTMGNNNTIGDGSTNTNTTSLILIGDTNTVQLNGTSTISDAGTFGEGNIITASGTGVMFGVYLMGTQNTVENDIANSEDVDVVGNNNDVDGAPSTVQIFGHLNQAINVSYDNPLDVDQVIVGAQNLARHTGGGSYSDYFEVFGHQNYEHDCFGCIAIGAGVEVATNSLMGIGMSRIPELRFTPSNIQRTPLTMAGPAPINTAQGTTHLPVIGNGTICTVNFTGGTGSGGVGQIYVSGFIDNINHYQIQITNGGSYTNPPTGGTLSGGAGCSGSISAQVNLAVVQACISGLEGSFAAITDSTTSVPGTVITGTGSNHVLGYCNGTNWVVAAGAPGLASPLTTKGDIWVYSTVNTRLPVGTDGQVLSAASSQATGLQWINAFTNPMTGVGDTIYGGTGGAVTRLAGSTSASTLCLTETGTGSAANPPTWGACSGSTAVAFSAITGSTNTSAAMVVGTGASLATSGSGTIAATSAPASGLTGTTLAAGVVNSSLTSVGTITTGTWQGTPIANAFLANSSTTVNGQVCTLGSTCTISLATAFSGITTGTNTTATMTVGSGASLVPTGSGIVQATNISSTITQGTNITITGAGTVASPYVITAAGTGTPGGSNGQIQYKNGSVLGGFTASGDATINTSTGVVTVTKTNGVAFSPLATLGGVHSGDIAYYNGTTWTTFAGSTVTSQCFTENSSGTPAWASCLNPLFSAIGSGTNTTATMRVSTGASLAPTGSGTIQANVISGTISGGTNVTITGSGTTAAPYVISSSGGGGGGGSGTANFYALWTNSTTLGNGHLDDGVTTAAVVTSSEPVAINSTGTSTQINLTYSVGHAPTTLAGSAVIAPDTTGNLTASENGAAFARVCTATNGICATGSATVGSAEVVAFSATPTFSPSFNVSRIVLTGNITSFTLGAAATDGQDKKLCFKQGTGPWTVTPPANVHGFFTIGIINGDWNCQAFVWDNTDSIWMATTPGTINQ